MSGKLTASVGADTTGTGTGGVVNWTYTVADDSTDFLVAGQTATETFTVTISDGHGGSVTQAITVTVIGINEAPTITTANATGSVTEDATTPNLSTTGTISFKDVDLTDTHTTDRKSDA